MATARFTVGGHSVVMTGRLVNGNIMIDSSRLHGAFGWGTGASASNSSSSVTSNSSTVVSDGTTVSGAAVATGVGVLTKPKLGAKAGVPFGPAGIVIGAGIGFLTTGIWHLANNRNSNPPAAPVSVGGTTPASGESWPTTIGEYTLE